MSSENHFYMKILILKTFLIISLISCRESDSLLTVKITPNIYKSGDTLFLKWSFKNNTHRNLIIPTLFTFRRLDGEDRRRYLFKKNFPVLLLDKNKDYIITVPYKYLKQNPSLKEEIALQKQIKDLDYAYDPDYFIRETYAYIEDQSIIPELVILNSKSEKQLIFMIKPNVSGKFVIGFESKKEIDRSSIQVIGDSISKKGFPRLKDIISNKVGDYELEYGEFSLDSVQVDL